MIARLTRSGLKVSSALLHLPVTSIFTESIAEGTVTSADFPGSRSNGGKLPPLQTTETVTVVLESFMTVNMVSAALALVAPKVMTRRSIRTAVIPICFTLFSFLEARRQRRFSNCAPALSSKSYSNGYAIVRLPRGVVLSRFHPPGEDRRETAPA